MANASFINLYENQAGYNAETHGVNGSEVSLIDDIEKVVFDGVNVELPEGVVPSVGFVLWVDGNGGKHFYEGSSVNAAKLTAQGQTFVGVVVDRSGRKAKVMHKTEIATRFVNAWCFKITGYSAGTPIVFNQYNKSNDTVASTVSGFTPTEDDVASASAFATALNSFLTTHQPTESSTAADTNWSAAVMQDNEGNDMVAMFVEGSSTDGVYFSQRQSPIASGATAAVYIWEFIGLSSNSLTSERNDGVLTWAVAYNKSRIKQYNQNINSPTDSLSSTGIYSQSNFTAANCPTVYAAYGGDYDRYLDAMMLKYPASLGISAYFGKAKDVCDALYDVSFTSVITSSTKKLFKAIEETKNLNDYGAGLDWYIPGFEECKAIYGDMLVNGTDKINSSFIKSGGSARVWNKYRWIPFRYSNITSWIISENGHGFNGAFHGLNYVDAIAVLEF